MKQVTNKLFYNKWPYKVRCYIEGARVIKNLGIDSNGIKWHRFTGMSNRYNRHALDKFYKISKDFFNNSKIKVRIEHYSVDFYLLDVDSFNTAKKILAEYISGSWEPSNNFELIQLLNNKKISFCNRLPHNKYQYKVYFKEMPPVARQNLISWAEKYNNKEIFIKNTTKIHFNNIKYKFCDHYFYVHDTKTLFMLEIAASGFIRKVEEYVLRNSINNENDQ